MSLAAQERSSDHMMLLSRAWRQASRFRSVLLNLEVP